MSEVSFIVVVVVVVDIVVVADAIVVVVVIMIRAGNIPIPSTSTTTRLTTTLDKDDIPQRPPLGRPHKGELVQPRIDDILPSAKEDDTRPEDRIEEARGGEEAARRAHEGRGPLQDRDQGAQEEGGTGDGVDAGVDEKGRVVT